MVSENPQNRKDADPASGVNKSLHLSCWQRHARLWMGAVLLLTDLTSIMLSGFLAITTRYLLLGDWDIGLYSQIFPLGLVCLGAYALYRLYPGIGLGIVNELRRLTITTTMIVLGLAAMTFWTHNPQDYSRLALSLTWLFSLVLVPLGRAVIRYVGSHFDAWGEPVVVFGNGILGGKLIDALQKNRSVGLYPVAVFDPQKEQNEISGSIPVFSGSGDLLFDNLSRLKALKTAIVVLPDTSKDLVKAIVSDQKVMFQRLILIPEQEDINTLGVTSMALDKTLGLQVNQNLLDKFSQLQKRAIDIAVALSGLVILAPFLALIAILIRLDSPGPAFFRQVRVGKDGRLFRLIKFRSMQQEAEIVLQNYLQNDQVIKEEWDHYQKIKNDPRITRIGKFLRKYSIDEFPQLWNVLVGEMSLVGPRPFMPQQRELYGERDSYYVRVRPGITGCWQVSGRNALEFIDRAYWDEYYVRNWSVWLDIYIILRTPGVVFKRGVLN